MSLREDFIFYAGEKPAYQAVYETLRDAIVCGRIPKGERMLEIYYAEIFNVSRTPIRSAFRKLANNGLAVEVPGGGVEAKGLDVSGIENIFKFQQALERLAFPQVIQNMTREALAELFGRLADCERLIDQDMQLVAHLNESVHRKLLEISRFEGIMEAVDLAYGFVQAFNLLAARDRGRQIAITEEHRAILSAIQQRDQVLLNSVADYHLEACRLFAVQFYQKLPRL